MKIIVPIKLVPDLVEELTIDPGGAMLDRTWMRMIINEFDEHAIEQAILIKESLGGHVTVLAQDCEGIDDVLFTSLAKGADKLEKFYLGDEATVNNHALARIMAETIKTEQPDLVLTGVQAHDDLDGSLGPLLAGYLGWPYVGYISRIQGNNGYVTVEKEYPGGLIAEMVITLPAVLGIQAAETPPRYVAVSKVRQAMKTAQIDELDVAEVDCSGGPLVSAMYQPETGERATILEGEVEEVAEELARIIKDLGLIS
jgi:electron transfer flavoprotein beta subunit